MPGVDRTPVEVYSKNGRRLGRNSVIDYEKMIEMRMVEDRPVEEIADHFGVTTQAIYQAMKRVKKDSIAQVYSRGQDYADKHLTISGVLVGLMQDAAGLLNDIKEAMDDEEWDRTGIEKRKLLLATSAEMRQQLSLYADIEGKMYSVEAHEEFQKMVMDAIQEASPEVAEKIKDKLNRKYSLRQFIGENRRNK